MSDPNTYTSEKIVAGFKEMVTIEIQGITFTKTATLDTGNGSRASTLGCALVEELEGGAVRVLINEHELHLKKEGESCPTIGQTKEKRVTVLLDTIRVCGRELHGVEFALVDNRNKSTDILLNRALMADLGIIIDPAREYLFSAPLSRSLSQDDNV